MSIENRQNKIGIDADSNLYEPKLRRRSARLLKMIREYEAQHRIIRAPWLDVGAGQSYMRDLLRSEFGLPIDESSANLDNVPYEYGPGYFKFITSFEVLEHLLNPLWHLRELNRVLHPDGNLLLVTPNDYSLIYKAEHLLSRKYRPHFHQFCERDLHDIMEKSGFEIKHMRKFFKSPSGTLARISRNGFFVHAVKKA
jgi:SAM-dependent methyltransferase